MGLPPGRTNNPRGRPANKPNKITRELRDRIKLFLDGNFEQIERDFKSLDPEKRILFFERYLKYELPERKSTETDINIRKLSDDQISELLERIFKKQ